MVLPGVALDAVSVMALTGFATNAAMSLLITMEGLALPPWRIAADTRVAQATSQVDAGLDAEKVKQLDAEAERLYKAGKYAEATAIAERSLAWKEVNLGPEHPDTAQSLNNLALLYGSQGLYAKAEPFFKRALAINEKALGPEYIFIAHGLNSSALLYNNQSNHTKADHFALRGLTFQFILIQREAPYLPVNERQSFLNSYGNAYERAFSSAQRGSSGANLALFGLPPFLWTVA